MVAQAASLDHTNQSTGDGESTRKSIPYGSA